MPISYVIARDHDILKEWTYYLARSRWEQIFSERPVLILDFCGELAREVILYSRVHSHTIRRMLVMDLALGWVFPFNAMRFPFGVEVLKVALDSYTWENGERELLDKSIQIVNDLNKELTEGAFGVPAVLALASAAAEGKQKERIGALLAMLKKEPYFSTMGYPLQANIDWDERVTENGVFVVDFSRDRAPWIDAHFIEQCQYDEGASKFMAYVILEWFLQIAGGRDNVLVMVNGAQDLVGFADWEGVLRRVKERNWQLMLNESRLERNETRLQYVEVGAVRNVVDLQWGGKREFTPYPPSREYERALPAVRTASNRTMEEWAKIIRRENLCEMVKSVS